MFGNFIYFIIVLLIYITYQPSEEPHFSPFDAFTVFSLFSAGFIVFTRIQFRRLEEWILNHQFSDLDHRFDNLMTRQSILAVVLFTINVYGLELPSFFWLIPPFSFVPTLHALLFLGLFVIYLSVIWYFAWPSYRALYAPDQSRRTYIVSNLSFSVPILLPWVLMSLIADIINALPFDQLKWFLNTAEGQVVFFLVFLFIVAVAAPVLIQKFWRCRPLEPGVQRDRIEALCRRANLRYAEILYWPIFGGRMITAGVMGLFHRFRYILVTDALLRFLRPEEIDTVIAHEIGHVKKHHLLFYLFFFIGFMLISFRLFDLIILFIIYSEPVYRFIEHTGFSHTSMASAVHSTVFILVFIIYFRFVFGYFMRNFERQADTYVYSLFHSSIPLISTFEKIAMTSGQPADKPNWHHFSIQERINYLKKCEFDRKWITKQDRKIKKSILLYTISIIFIGAIGYQLSVGETGKQINHHFFEKILIREIEKRPDEPQLYAFLGDIYLRDKKYVKTIGMYETALKISEQNAHVLNNLAWVYATCEQTDLRNPEKALMLAQKAIELMQAPFIYDTLAECYFVNGQFEKAKAAGEKALLLTRENREYYQKQLDKFNSALNRTHQ